MIVPSRKRPFSGSDFNPPRLHPPHNPLPIAHAEAFPRNALRSPPSNTSTKETTSVARPAKGIPGKGLAAPEKKIWRCLAE